MKGTLLSDTLEACVATTGIDRQGPLGAAEDVVKPIITACPSLTTLQSCRAMSADSWTILDVTVQLVAAVEAHSGV